MNPANTPHDALHALRGSETPGWDAPMHPNAEFADALRHRLERGATLAEGIDMDTTQLERQLAEDDSPATLVERPGALPYLTVVDAHAAIDWYVAHLGGRLRGAPILMDDNRIGHAEVEIGGGAIYLADAFPDMGLTGPTTGRVAVSLMLPVTDTDAALRRARDGGARVEREPYEAHGTRGATVVDPFGHRWMLTGPVRSVLAEPTPTPRIQPGDIVYLSLQTADAARAARFYGAVLGWEYDPDSRQVTNIGHRLGIFDGAGYGTSGTLYCVYAVDDFSDARAAIVAAGGQAGEISVVARDGYRVMDATDDQGVAFSVHVPDPDEPRPTQYPDELGAMSYLTVHTPNSARFRKFYGAVLDWRFRAGRIDDGWEVDGAHPQIGVAGGAQTHSTAPMWNVADIAAAVAAVRAAGGRVLEEPTRQPYGISARCADDQGGEFYLGQLT